MSILIERGKGSRPADIRPYVITIRCDTHGCHNMVQYMEYTRATVRSIVTWLRDNTDWSVYSETEIYCKKCAQELSSLWDAPGIPKTYVPTVAKLWCPEETKLLDRSDYGEEIRTDE